MNIVSSLLLIGIYIYQVVMFYMLCLSVFCFLLLLCAICVANETVSMSLCSQLSVSFLTCKICRVLLVEPSCWYCHYADTKWSIFCWVAANLYSLKILTWPGFRLPPPHEASTVGVCIMCTAFLTLQSLVEDQMFWVSLDRAASCRWVVLLPCYQPMLLLHFLVSHYLVIRFCFRHVIPRVVCCICRFFPSLSICCCLAKWSIAPLELYSQILWWKQLW